MKSELKSWNPFADFGEFRSPFRSLLPSLGGNGLSKLLENSDWEPAVDIEETDKAFVITADLPDVKKKDINVTIEDGILMLSGTREKSDETKEKTFHRVERFHGNYQRSFRLPENVNEDKIDSKLKDGALTITLPKIAIEKKAPARQVAIS